MLDESKRGYHVSRKKIFFSWIGKRAGDFLISFCSAVAELFGSEIGGGKSANKSTCRAISFEMIMKSSTKILNVPECPEV